MKTGALSMTPGKESIDQAIRSTRRYASNERVFQLVGFALGTFNHKFRLKIKHASTA